MKWLIATLFLSFWSVSENYTSLVRIGGVEFKTEIANTRSTRSKGLMFRDEILPHQAMLFVYPQDKKVAFWMKNVSFPIDIIFIDACGVIVKIHENAIPEDQSPIPSGKVIRAVLEIQGGASKLNQIRPGSIVMVDFNNKQLFDSCNR